MKILKCCANCNNRYNGICCCSLPDSCHEYVDIPDEHFFYNDNSLYYNKVKERDITIKSIIIKKTKTYDNNISLEQRIKIQEKVEKLAINEMKQYLFNNLSYKINSSASETTNNITNKCEYNVFIFLEPINEITIF